MFYQEHIEKKISKNEILDLADMFDEIMLNDCDMPEKVLEILNIKYIEPYDSETESAWIKRIENTEYGIVESFCSSCNLDNTYKTLDIARRKGKLADFFHCMFGEDRRNHPEIVRSLIMGEKIGVY